MAFDSILPSAGALFVVSVAAFVRVARLKASVRVNIRFAATLLAAIAIAAPFSTIGDIAALVALPPATAALGLAAMAQFAGRAPVAAASVALAASLGSGLAAVIAVSPMLAAVPAALGAFVIIAAALQDLAWIAALSGLAMMGGVFALLQQGTGSGLLLFAALALLGLSRSAFLVKQQGQGRCAAAAIRGVR